MGKIIFYCIKILHKPNNGNYRTCQVVFYLSTHEMVSQEYRENYIFLTCTNSPSQNIRLNGSDSSLKLTIEYKVKVRLCWHSRLSD